MTQSTQSIIVAGGGPVGLAAALFLQSNGCAVRVLETRLRPNLRSKALAVNPRTLELLEKSGVTERMLQLGLPLKHADLWREDGSRLAKVGFSELNTEFPFMLGLSQAVTEKLLAEALALRGVSLERGRTVMSAENVHGGARVKLADGELIEADYVIGADGAHSTVRESLGIPFEGTSLEGEWHLADVELKTDLDPSRAHVIFGNGGGFFFAVRVVEDRSCESGLLWRVISSNSSPSEFPRGRPIAPPLWESSFRVSHRIAAELGRGAVFLAGDAAHLHSPIGARGMNLGIEDAWVFADLLAKGKLEEYASRRSAVDRQVVHRVDRLSRLAAGKAAPLRTLRDLFLPEAMKLSFFRHAVERGISGLDHQVA